MKNQFIKIKNTRYRLSTIKKYQEYTSDRKDDKYILKIFYSVLNCTNATIHAFKTGKERNEIIDKLDSYFNTL